MVLRVISHRDHTLVVKVELGWLDVNNNEEEENLEEAEEVDMDIMEENGEEDS